MQYDRGIPGVQRRADSDYADVQQHRAAARLLQLQWLDHCDVAKLRRFDERLQLQWCPGPVDADLCDEHDAGVLQLQRHSDSNHADLHLHAGVPVLQRHPDSYDAGMRLLAVLNELRWWVLGRHLIDVLIRLSELQRDPDSNRADVHLDYLHANPVPQHDADDLVRVDSGAPTAPAAAVRIHVDNHDTRGRHAGRRLNASWLDNPDAAARVCHTDNRDAGDAHRLANADDFADFNAIANGYRDRSADVDAYSRGGVRSICGRPDSHRSGADVGQRRPTTDESSPWLADVLRVDHRHI